MEKQKNRELLFSVTKDDLDIQTFRAGKNGGQRGDKVNTAVRIVHKESGAVGLCQDERMQSQNMKIAFRRLVWQPSFIAWRKRKAYELMQEVWSYQELLEKVEQLMKPSNLKIEVKDENGEWCVSN